MNSKNFCKSLSSRVKVYPSVRRKFNRYVKPYRGRMILLVLLVYLALISQISEPRDENEFEVMIISEEFVLKSDP